MTTHTMYMHTLNGRPACYDEHCGYMYFVGSSPGESMRLVASLKELRREQERDAQNTADLPRDRRYGYVRVAVPTA